MKRLYINAMQRLMQCMMKVIFTIGRCVVLTQEALFVQAFKSWITEVPSWPFFKYVTKLSALKDSFDSSSSACCAAVVCAEWCYWKPLSGAMSIYHSVRLWLWDPLLLLLLMIVWHREALTCICTMMCSHEKCDIACLHVDFMPLEQFDFTSAAIIKLHHDIKLFPI